MFDTTGLASTFSQLGISNTTQPTNAPLDVDQITQAIICAMQHVTGTVPSGTPQNPNRHNHTMKLEKYNRN